MPIEEARSEETPYGRHIPSEGWFVLNLGDALAGASAANETDDPDEAYADWPGEYRPVRLPWPPRGRSTHQ